MVLTSEIERLNNLVYDKDQEISKYIHDRRNSELANTEATTVEIQQLNQDLYELKSRYLHCTNELSEKDAQISNYTMQIRRLEQRIG